MGSVHKRLEGYAGQVDSVAFSLDGTLLSSGRYDNVLKIWNPETGRPLRTLSVHSGPVHVIAFSAMDGCWRAGVMTDR